MTGLDLRRLRRAQALEKEISGAVAVMERSLVGMIFSKVFLETAVRMKDRHQILMFSAVADKDYVSMIKEIVESGAFDEYIVCTVEYTNRAMPANVFLDTFKKFTDKPVFLRETAKEALDCALERKGENARLFIAGSLYLVGEIKRMFLKENK